MKMKIHIGLLCVCMFLAVMFVSTSETKANQAYTTEVRLMVGQMAAGDPVNFSPALQVADENGFATNWVIFDKSETSPEPSGFKWYDVTADKNVSPGDKYELGHVYKIAGAIKTYYPLKTPGFEFSVSYVPEMHHLPEIHYYSPFGKYDNHAFTFAFWFPAITKPINTESVVLDLEPKAGTHTDHIGIVPDGALYTASDTQWYHNDEVYTGNLEYGESYKLKTTLVPVGYNHFVDDGWKGWHHNGSWCTSSKAVFGKRDKVYIACDFTMPWQITFSAEGGKGTMAQVEVENDTLYILPPCGFTALDLYDFDRWNLGASGDQIRITENTELIALWKPKASYKNINSCTVNGVKTRTYNGKAQTQSVTVKDGTKTLKGGTDYTVSYNNNKNAGTATLTITGKGDYKGSIKKTFKINKAANPMTVKAKKTVNAKAEKDTTIKNVVAVKKSQGEVTYKTNSKKVTVKNGNLIVKKGLKKNKTYTVKITVTAKGSSNYNKSTKTVKVIIKVK